MKPSKLKRGDKVIFRCLGGTEHPATFIRRQPARAGRPAINHLQFPAFAGLNDSSDKGDCIVSDYDLSRKGRLANV